jgi:hypothetical protein
MGMALSTILWPGVIVRAITVSNADLELPLVLLCVLVVWNATSRPRPRSLIAASVLLGLCVLTQLTLVCLAVLLLVPLAKYLRERCDRLALGTATLTLALPLMLVAPWFALNESRYGALTGSTLVERLTAPNGPAAPIPGGDLDRPACPAADRRPACGTTSPSAAHSGRRAPRRTHCCWDSPHSSASFCSSHGLPRCSRVISTQRSRFLPFSLLGHGNRLGWEKNRCSGSPRFRASWWR